WWVWGVVILVAGIAYAAFIYQIVLGKSFGTKPAPDAMLWLVVLFCGIGLPWFLVSCRLVTEVRSDHIYVRFHPFWPRRIRFNEIKRCSARTYSPLREYGGWGLKWMPGSGWAYNMSGNRGIQLELETGKRILIGTQKPEEFLAALERQSVSS
ncbi:MAG: DUF6141 family protein, partial [Planctomycetota bacterium]|nr:DUF6141 family protein [Planctomycetota bacterium]